MQSIVETNLEISALRREIGYPESVEPIMPLVTQAPSTHGASAYVASPVPSPTPLERISVVETAWLGLNEEDKKSVLARYKVDLRQPLDFGIAVDHQGINESTQGTTGGAALGGALAQAAYIDRAFRGGNYSATAQLGLGLLGAILGSSLDRPAVQQYHYRYALKLANGEIVYRDSVQGDAFRHPVGICLHRGDLTPAPQSMCTQTADALRQEYLQSNK